MSNKHGICNGLAQWAPVVDCDWRRGVLPWASLAWQFSNPKREQFFVTRLTWCWGRFYGPTWYWYFSRRTQDGTGLNVSVDFTLGFGNFRPADWGVSKDKTLAFIKGPFLRTFAYEPL